MFQFQLDIFDNVVVVQLLNVHFLDLMLVNPLHPTDFNIGIRILEGKTKILFVYVNNQLNVVVELNLYFLNDHVRFQQTFKIKNEIIF